MRTDEHLVTSDHVLLETWLLLRHRLHHHVADAWEKLRTEIAAIESVNQADLEAAWHIGQSWSGNDFSLADRTSFAIMMRMGIEKAASFDSGFAIFRFGSNRCSAFTILS